MSDELANELAQPTYDFNGHGGFVVESKRKMKIRGVASPNIADALALTEYFHNIAYRLWKNPTVKKTRVVQPQAPKTFGKKRSKGWMAA